MSNLVVSRFSEETLNCNREYRERTGIGCVYGTPLPMNQFYPAEVVFVVEMNLSANRIEGVGLVLNIVRTGNQFDMYGNYNYNRYVYTGKYRLDREDLESLTIDKNRPPSNEPPPPAEPEIIRVVDVLDQVLFKGRSHMKRGTYFSRITDKLVYRAGGTCKKVQDSIYNAFIDKFNITINMEEDINYEQHGLGY
jgi:hypothetical protein